MSRIEERLGEMGVTLPNLPMGFAASVYIIAEVE